jgi:hypothetical protein
MIRGKRKINQPVKLCVSVIWVGFKHRQIWTDKYKDIIHVVLQSLNPGFVVALRFFPVKSPERVGTAIKIAYHARFSTMVPLEDYIPGLWSTI